MSGEQADLEKLRALRELIPATSAGIYLDTAYRGPLPAETAAAMRDADDWELRVGRATEGRDEDFAQKRDEARAVIAALLGGDLSDVVLTNGDFGWSGGLPEVQLVQMVDPTTGAISRTPRSTDGLVALEATLSVGAVPVDALTLDVDLISLAGDRWLLGPEAVGAVWVGPRARRAGVELRDAALGRTQVVGFARSVGWLEMYVGLDWIYQRGRDLARRLHEALVTIDGVDVVTPADALATVVVFRLRSWPVETAQAELRSRAFAIIGTDPGGAALRASVAWFNTAEEIDRFVAAVAEIARHTPETLPRRPTLTVVH